MLRKGKIMKKIICTICVLMFMFSIPIAAIGVDRYSDVDNNAWYSVSVDFVSKKALMQGVGNNLFAPNDYITRAMAITVLWRHAGQPDSTDCNFCDVYYTDWFAEAASWGDNCGIVKGYPIEGVIPGSYAYYWSFEGQKTITREELACFLYRYAKYAGADVSESASLEGFADAASVSDWAEVALGWCVAKDILQGTPAGDSLNLAPADHATRAEVAAMLMRYCQMIGQ